MQLTKAKLRRMPTYHLVTAPYGVRRAQPDFNQLRNAQQRNRNFRGDNWEAFASGEAAGRL